MPPKDQDSGLTVVATVSGMLNAQVLKAHLEDAGIAAILDYESAGLIFGISSGGLSRIQILVADRDAEEAIEILNTPPPPGWDQEANESSHTS